MAKNKILIPVDEAEFTLQIVPYLFRYLIPEENEVILLHITERPATPPVKLSAIANHTGTTDQTQASIQDRFTLEVLPYLQALRKAGFMVSTHVRFGNPTQAIEQFMQSEAVSLVVMTTASGADLVNSRGTVQHIMQQTTVPVMLYHAATEVGTRTPSQLN